MSHTGITNDQMLEIATARLARFDDIVRHNGMMNPDLSHAEVANRVRMLMRSDLDHEMVCVLARNRIITLANLLGEATDLVAQFKSCDYDEPKLQELLARLSSILNPEKP